MANGSKCWLIFLAILLLVGTSRSSLVDETVKNGVKTAVYLSPKFELEPGSVCGNDGLCPHGLSQYFGLGSETRKTSTCVPDPYGIEFGSPAKIPSGYEEKWLLNGFRPKLSRGLRCCYDNTRCRLKEGFGSVKRTLYLKYTVKYVDWHNSIVPVRVYIFDVTDKWRKHDDSTGTSSRHDCQIEYSVESCSNADENGSCVHTKSVSIILPTGGDVVYGVAHQHTGGIGSTLYGEDGRVLCSSTPIYGQGKEPGNEAGYIVGMSTCYPQPGSVKISDGETLTVVSNYSSAQGHTGVMGLFYILVADFDSSSAINSSQDQNVGLHAKMLTPHYISGMALLGVAALAVSAFAFQRRNQRGDIYEPIPMGVCEIVLATSLLLATPFARLTFSFTVKEMALSSDFCVLSFIIILLLLATVECTEDDKGKGVKTEVFLSPKFEMEPGEAAEKIFYNISFPRGHIAIKSFNAEVVDNAGNPVPLHETYLHHWIAMRYYQPKGLNNSNKQESDDEDYIVVKNNGICGDHLPQYFGLGSETRKTATLVPDPYGIEVGNPAEIPAGYEEGWMFDLHAIDTRNAENKLGCTECRCELYNVTKDENGKVLDPHYLGGMNCCRDGTRCKLKEGYQNVKKSLFLRYTVKYVPWNNSILPVQVYVLDVTATRNEQNGHSCQVEYQINSCSATVAQEDCIHSKNSSISLPSGGEVIYGVAHQHTGGLGSTLFGEDGRVICSSEPIYGQGGEAGNESGYIVGMSTCYPQPGTVKISDGEILTLVSNYSNAQKHTGVMGLFYLLVADTSSLKPNSDQLHKETGPPYYVWIAIAILAALILALFITSQRKCRNRGYQTI
ncbi:OLC1v1014439C1 [Oldenlandia corymbosa var. corymbosa]|uniref:OLC1v1014439C1 n=1 Tax=Oldenlandia corymbosa var. corymbosa TaxID=529605 RepID=A0AAV1E401_OLDCO|nr:OLC1v1014439C1 [Oldenlandia corymbosa var. corymbosa]